jgi:hypothetical protein
MLTQLGNIAIVSTDKNIDIYKVCNFMRQNDWKLTGQPKYPSIHLTLHHNNKKQLDDLIDKVAKGAEAVRKDPKGYLVGPSRTLEVMSTLPESIAVELIQSCYHELFDIENLDTEKIQAHQTQQSASHVKNK